MASIRSRARLGVLGPGGGHVQRREALVHRAVALPQQETGVLDLVSSRPPCSNRGFQTFISCPSAASGRPEDALAPRYRPGRFLPMNGG